MLFPFPPRLHEAWVIIFLNTLIHSCIPNSAARPRRFVNVKWRPLISFPQTDEASLRRTSRLVRLHVSEVKMGGSRVLAYSISRKLWSPYDDLYNTSAVLCRQGLWIDTERLHALTFFATGYVHNLVGSREILGI